MIIKGGSMKELLSGNEAIARGVYEAGVKLASAYPGTPSTEILENIAAKYPEIYSEWAPNEKVALEVAIGASMAGARALATMKHVGVNVAADPLFTLSYTGVNGGLVVVTCDDPELHSSQNEQDNRHYGKAAKMPVIEPSDSEEAKEFMKEAFEISEKFDTPILYRSTTRISHSKSIVIEGERIEREMPKELSKESKKYTMLPVFARQRHPIIEERLKKLSDYGSTCKLNKVEYNDTSIGIVTSGVAYQYAKEVFPEASILKLGLTYPLPEKLIREFASKVDKLYVIEELDPFLEEEIKLLGINVDKGKNVVPICGELDQKKLREVFNVKGDKQVYDAEQGLPLRPPTLCPGCAHRGLFSILGKLKCFVSGDIGCYTLGALPPLAALHTCVDMGASIGMAHGINKVFTPDSIKNKTVAVIGDSTFFHSGITGLLNMIYNRGTSVVVIMDNRTTAMTGGQENPGTGKTLMGQPAIETDIIDLVKALGVKNVEEIDTYDLKSTEEALKNALEKEELTVLVCKRPCVLQYKVFKPALKIDEEKCKGCKACIKVGCIALSLKEINGETKAEIDPNMCVGCGVCAQVCKFDAIV
jgi:indolepyruvate ferredoxin oxidoreductase alpha subunit